MKNTFFFVLLLILFSNCENRKPKNTNEPVTKNKLTQNLKQRKGFELMQQKCFICHFPVPDPAKTDQMIAPPMVRVQEHYKPAYPEKEAFVDAIKAWVAKPSEDKVMMPGAVRKFKIMPYMAYQEEDIQLIAETLYDFDFGVAFPKNDLKQRMATNQKLQLNSGNKWQLDATAITSVKNIIKELKDFDSQEVEEYQQLGNHVFNTAKTLILDKNTDAKALAQVQVFFHNVEDNMHQLMQVKTVEDGKEQRQILQKKFSKFFDFFE